MAYNGRFFPREDLVTRLKDETRQVAGYDIYDVRWDTGRIKNGKELPGRDCLCVYEKTRRGTEIVRLEIRDPPTDPSASRVFEYVNPDGSPAATEIPLGPEDNDYVKKCVGSPRQLNETDVDHCIEAARNAVRRSKEAIDKLKKMEEYRAKEAERIREEYTSEAAKDLVKIFQGLKSGKNAFLDLSVSDALPESGPPKINDMRRVV